MIYQVRASEEKTKLLRQLLDIQLCLLSLAVDESQLTSSESEIVGNVEARLRDIYPDATQTNEVTRWITRRKVKKLDLSPEKLYQAE